MVLNPRGINDKYEVEAAMDDVRAQGELRFNDTPQGRFLSQLRGSYNNVPSAYGAGAPVPVAAGQAIGQSGLPARGYAPDLYAVQPAPVEVYRAEETVDDKQPADDATKEPAPEPKDTGVRSFIEGLGKWPVAPLVIGGAIILVFYALYRALK